MKTLCTIATGASGANASQVLDSFPAGQVCQGFYLQGSVPLNNVSGAPLALTAGMFTQVLQHFLASFTLRYGLRQNRMAYPGISGDILRDIQQALNQDAIVSNWAAISPVAAGAFTGTFSLLVMFDAPLWNSSAPRLPGTTQMRTMRIDIQEGPSDVINAGNINRGAGNAVFNIIPVTKPGEDQWAPVLSFGQVNSTALYTDFPDGLPLMLWEATTTVAATAILSYLLEIGRQVQHDNIPPGAQYWELLREMDIGGVDTGLTYCTLYWAGRTLKLEDLPHGPVRFTMPTQYVTPVQLRGVYYPAMTEQEAQEAVVCAAQTWRTEVLGSTVGLGETVNPGAPACAPFKLYTPDKPEFVMNPGLIGHQNGVVSIGLPDVVAKQGGQIKASTDRITAGQMISRLQRQIARRIPGAIATSGEASGVAGAEIQKAFLHLYT